MFEYALEDYNYADFVLSRELPLFQTFREHLHVGERPADFELLELDEGRRVRLSDFWTDTHLIIEFGSFT